MAIKLLLDARTCGSERAGPRQLYADVCSLCPNGERHEALLEAVARAVVPDGSRELSCEISTGIHSGSGISGCHNHFEDSEISRRIRTRKPENEIWLDLSENPGQSATDLTSRRVTPQWTTPDLQAGIVALFILCSNHSRLHPWSRTDFPFADTSLKMSINKPAHSVGNRKSLNTKSKRVLRLAHGEGREAILEATVRAVAREGTSGFNYRSVAKQAGVSHALVHYHFGSREVLMVESYKWAARRVIEIMHVLPNENWIEEYANRLVNLSPQDGQLHIFMNTLALDAASHGARRKLIEPVFTVMFRAVRNALRAAQVNANAALARLITATLIGVTFQHQALAAPRSTRKTLDELLQIIESLRRPQIG